MQTSDKGHPSKCHKVVFVCLFNGVLVGIPQIGFTPLHFMCLSQVRNLFGNGPVSYCFVYIISMLVIIHKKINSTATYSFIG